MVRLLADFRNILNNLQLNFGRLSCFVEIQIHHAKIYKLNETKHAHSHLDYWRAVLASSYDDALDSYLERVFDFLQEINGNPTLLSMLVLCLKGQQPGRIHLPTTILELYRAAIEHAVQRQRHPENALFILRSIASANMQAGRRIFTSKNFDRAVGGRTAWMLLADKQGALPLIKTLEEGTCHHCYHDPCLPPKHVNPLPVADKADNWSCGRQRLCFLLCVHKFKCESFRLPISAPELPGGALRP